MPSKTSSKNSPPTAADRASLDAALEMFRGSSRAVMFAPLSLGAFTKKTDKFPKKISALLFEELLPLNSVEIARLYGLKSKDARAITAILHSLLEGDTPAVAPQAPDAVAALLSPRSPVKQSSLGINSVEAELKLTAALAKLRTSPMLKSLAHHRIGDYWDSSWARAPFEEALTFEQLSQLKPRSLLDKRSVTPQKLSHLLEALERGLSGAPLSAAHPTQTPPQSTTSPQNITISLDRWKLESSSYTSTLLGALALYSEESNKVPAHFTELGRILSALPAQLSAKEYLAATLQEEFDLSTTSVLLKIDPNTVTQCTETASKKIHSLLKELAPVLHQSLVTTLVQPATPINSLVKLLRPDAPSAPFATTISMLLARAVGASPIVIGGQAKQSVWSTNSSAAERAVRLLIAGLPKSDSELQADAAALLGNLPFDTIREWLRPLTFFDERRQSWSKRD